MDYFKLARKSREFFIKINKIERDKRLYLKKNNRNFIS